MITVGILLFNEVEVLDFAGPFEVFSLAKQDDQKPFKVVTIADNKDYISARNGLKVIPEYRFDNCPPLNVLIVPGGYGAEEIAIKNQNLLNWIKTQSKQVQILASVCTGAILLAECGLLDGKKATTHWADFERLEKDYPKVQVIHDVKYVDENEIITSGGISAGINMSFHLVKRLTNLEVAKDTAKRMEYDIQID